MKRAKATLQGKSNVSRMEGVEITLPTTERNG